MKTIWSLFKYSAAENLLKQPDLPSDWVRGQFPSWRDSSRKALHLWLATLAMVLSPQLRSLLLAIDHNAAFSDLANSLYIKLPSLRTLGLLGNLKDYHFAGPRALYAVAPNLDTVYTYDGQGWHTMAPRPSYRSECKLELSNVRRLAISDLLPNQLGHLLLHIPKLEELEYYWDGGHTFILDDLADMLRPVKKNAQKILLESPTARHREHTRASVSRLCEREQMDQLVTLLPLSIRKFRILHLFQSIHMSLSRLAVMAPRYKVPTPQRCYNGRCRTDRSRLQV
ncbi:hypothetical protein F4811DRAFT_529915 [Daldinia bambusicola]|nr:hypothetical protein F4811DRAFT_529915 [Daldinia bambusicola]